jgi:hypothetical protein
VLVTVAGRGAAGSGSGRTASHNTYRAIHNAMSPIVDVARGSGGGTRPG